MDKIKALETVRVSNPKRLLQTGRVYPVGAEGHITTRQAERLVEAGYAEAHTDGGSDSSDDSSEGNDSASAYTVQKGDGGWWKVIGPDGEPVEGESEQSEEAAQANADALNSNA